jgi:hypothetical protein
MFTLEFTKEQLEMIASAIKHNINTLGEIHNKYNYDNTMLPDTRSLVQHQIRVDIAKYKTLLNYIESC